MRGEADARFDRVRTLPAENLASGEELGACRAVDVGGETVVDVWGGHTDAARSTPWGEHTIVNVWSSTRTVTNLAALILVERGLLDVFEPVATYWPEFAANGKWPPGTASGYHASNQGHLVGARAEDDHRVAEIIPPPPLEFDLGALPPNHLLPDGDLRGRGLTEKHRRAQGRSGLGQAVMLRSTTATTESTSRPPAGARDAGAVSPTRTWPPTAQTK